MPRLVGITGKKRAGKDTAAAALIEHGFTRVGFADAVKESALILDPIVQCTMEECWGYGYGGEAYSYNEAGDGERLSDVVGVIGWERAKDEYPEVRAFLQRHGDGTRRVLGDDVWVNTWGGRVELVDGPVVVPDVRYLNEAEHVRALGGLVIRIERPGLTADDGHVSETEQDHIVPDVTITNSGDVSDLHRKVVAASL
jgi:hypothetical protein